MATVLAIPEPKSTPDIAKIKAMTTPLLMVNRFLAKGVPGEVLVTEENINVEKILQYHRSEVTRQFGAGVYRFEVVDTSGTEKDIWTCRYGADAAAGASPLAAVPSIDVGGNPMALQDMGGGYRYNPVLQVIAGPKGVFQWTPGTPLPPQIDGSMPTVQIGPGATPIHPGMTPWGTQPAFGGQMVDDPRIKALEDQLRQRELADQQRSHEAAIAKLTDGFQRTIEALNQRIEGLVLKIGEAKTAGPNPELEALKLQIAQANERAERAEQRAREDAMTISHRADIARLESLITAFTNKPAPDTMAPLLTAMIGQSQAASTAAVDAVRDASATATAKLSEAAMTPDRLAVLIGQLTQQMQGQGQGFNVMMMDAFAKMMGLQHKLTAQQIEMERAGQAPPWMGLVEQGMDAIGQVGKAIAMRQSTPPPQQPVRRMPVQARVVAPPLQQQLPAQPVAPAPAAAAPVAPAPKPRPAPRNERERNQRAREDMAAEMDRRDAEARAAAQQSNAPAPAPAPAPAAVAPPPANGVSRRPRRVVAPIPAAAPPAATTTAPNNVVQLPVAAASPPAPADEAPKLSLAQMAQIPVEQMREFVTNIPDEPYELDGQPQLGFFGSLLEKLGELRQGAMMGLEPATIAGYVFEGRKWLQGAGEYPPALELMAAGHFQVVCERLLPDAPPEYLEQVVNEVRALWTNPPADDAEAPAGEEEEGDEGEEEGDEEEGDEQPQPPAAS